LALSTFWARIATRIMSQPDEKTQNLLLTQLVHKGVLIPPPPDPRELRLRIRGTRVRLTAKQEEMALAWARKQGTPYVEDRVFVHNFLRDFGAALAIEPPLSIDEVDFGYAIRVIEAEREARASLSKEERKAQAAARKAKREALREEYGYTTVNGERTLLGTYMVEPSGIFMGRGKHPLRGRWKEGARREDITLNLCPDAPRPPGEWKEIVWKPDCLWVARWKDKLSGKLKYIWLGDTSPAKQAREAAKFDKAIELRAQLEQVRAYIHGGLEATDPTRRMVATACYLIDVLGLRVGDEKDPDEADTVGATTLRPEHVTLHPTGVAEFRFLGKDAVRWHKKLELPEVVQHNLAAQLSTARPPGNGAGNNSKRHPTRDKPQLFPDIGSHDVNVFLSEALPGLTAKVFRTLHATERVKDNLATCGVKRSDPEHAKWKAANLANLEAAVFCNHTKKAPASWPARRERAKQRQVRAEERVQRYRTQIREYSGKLKALRKEAREKLAACRTPKQREKRRISYRKRIVRAERRTVAAQERLQGALLAQDKLRAETLVASRKRTWNLTTSLKSYIDPRVFYRWGRSVEYDVLERYYSKTLRQKFSWVREADGQVDQN